MNQYVLYGTGVLLAAAAAFALFRVERGPSMLDRIVAVDVLVAAVLGTIAIYSAATGRTDLIPVMIVLALVGFVASVSIARFASLESDEDRRILTREEAAAEERRRADEEAEEEAAQAEAAAAAAAKAHAAGSGLKGKLKGKGKRGGSAPDPAAGASDAGRAEEGAS